MLKTSYKNKEKLVEKTLKNLPISQMQKSEIESATESGSRNGFIMPGDLYPSSPVIPQNTSYKKIIDDLLDVSDMADAEDLEKEADFIDFLIMKFANEEDNYEKNLINYIYSIYTSDIPDANNKIKKITLDFTKLTDQKIASGEDLLLAKRKSYQEVLSSNLGAHTEELSSLSLLKETKIVKKSQNYFGNDPKFIASQVASIIRIIIGRMSLESQNRARMNLRTKIKNLNQNEISMKKTPGGAGIGTSIALVKNILNGRDGYFIKSVIDNLTEIL
jgi:hypothetical protein